MPHPIKSDEALLLEETRSPRILFVEDDTAISRVFTAHAERYDCEFDTSGTGMRALEMVKLKEYDTVFLDMRLPDIEGVQLFQLLTTICPKINFVIISAFLSDSMIDEVMNIGFAIFVKKPTGFRPGVMDRLFKTLGIQKLEKWPSWQQG